MAPESTAAQRETPVSSSPVDELRTSSQSSPSVIGATLVMKGELTLDEDLVVDGRFEGTRIKGARRLSVSPYATVKGDVHVESADIAGTIEGALEGSGTVVVHRSARIRGEISAQTLRIENGTNLEDAVLSGRISLADPDGG